MNLRNSALCFLLLLFPLTTWAAMRAVVVTEDAMVYNQASFDARVIAYLHKNSHVVVSSKVYGAFRKVMVRRGEIGYISDVDVKSFKPSTRSRPRRPEPDTPAFHHSVAMTRYVGGLLGYVNYRELIAGARPAANLVTYGLKITGPGLIYPTTLLSDLNLAIHVGAPSYYGQGADVPPTGYLVMLDTPLLFPINDQRDSMFYAGAGPLLTYSSFDVILQKQSFELKEIKVGASLVVGYGRRVGDAIARFEAKYFIDRASYVGIQLAVQGAF